MNNEQITDSTADTTPAQEDVSRRQFLRKSGGAVAALAGMFGLGTLNNVAEIPQRDSGYGATPYGGKSKA